MRWLLLTDGLSPFEMGGMQKHSANLLRYLLKEGHFVSVAHCVTKWRKIEESEVRKQLEIKSKEVCDIKQFVFPKTNRMPGHYIKESYLYSQKLFQYYSGQQQTWDIVFAQGFTGWKFIEERKKNNWNVPVINHFHGLEMFQQSFGWKDKLQQFLFRPAVKWNLTNADFTVSLGGRITKIITSVGVREERVIALPVGIDPSWFSNSTRKQSEKKRLLFVGRFESRKGLETLLSAFKEVSNDQYEWSLTVVGNIPHSRRIPIEGVHYYGPILDEREMIQVMDDHDVLIVPSVAEGMPTVILEAMARGMAIWCTPVGANEVMVDEVNGFVFKSHRSSDIRAGLQQLASTTHYQLQAMGKGGYEKCKNAWSWPILMTKFLQDIQLFLEKRGVK
jgi:glycosyltransferase involved in cell wall biosynthesis